MGLVSFVKSAGRKLGFFGGQAAAEAEAAQQQAAAEAVKQAEEAAAALAAMHTAEARASAVIADIRAAILSHGVTIDGLEIAFANDIVRLEGTAPSQLDAERAILIAGNTEGVGGVDDQLQIVEPEPPAVYHTVISGDTLSKICLATYGNMRLYDVVFEANKPMLKHPDEIYPGQVLRLPRNVPPMVHTVAKGETLGAIAKHYYGNAKRYTDIFEANKGTLSSPDSIEVGQQLTIPHDDPSPANA